MSKKTCWDCIHWEECDIFGKLSDEPHEISDKICDKFQDEVGER